VVCALFLGNVALYAWHQGRSASPTSVAETHEPA
jgi:hypothetical protein